MSLIGSLEDLGLGDILQIISLSQKSGVLSIRSEQGEGRVVFVDGKVRGATLKGGPADLRAVLVGGGFVDAAAFDAAWSESRQQEVSLEDALTRHSELSPERLDSLRRESVESVVVQMFQWRSGEFSFDVREEPEPGDPPLFLPVGINAQYLAMEGSRVDDESMVEPVREEDLDDDDLSVEAMFGVAAEAPVGAPPAPIEPDPLDFVEPPLLDAELEVDDDPGAEAELLDLGDPLPAEVAALSVQATAAAEVAQAPPVIAIDPSLPVLEWAKRALSDDCERIHIFQRSELGLARIRQYIVRGEAPFVLLAPDAPGDPLSGIQDARDFARRLKTQSSRVRTYWLCEDGVTPPSRIEPGDGIALRPASHLLSNPRSGDALERSAERLREQLRPLWGSVASDSEAPDVATPDLLALRELTSRLSDPSSRGEVLPLVMGFAAERFSRVALFGVREELVIGIAQQGLSRAAGPDDSGLRAIRMKAERCAWFRRLLAERRAFRAPPSDPGDHELSLLLGEVTPREAYLAPIESAGGVVAILYGDNLPEGTPLADSASLEVVLHQAGLALDRTALERALVEAEREAPSGPPDSPPG